MSIWYRLLELVHEDKELFFFKKTNFLKKEVILRFLLYFSLAVFILRIFLPFSDDSRDRIKMIEEIVPKLERKSFPKKQIEKLEEGNKYKGEVI